MAGAGQLEDAVTFGAICVAGLTLWISGVPAFALLRFGFVVVLFVLAGYVLAPARLRAGERTAIALAAGPAFAGLAWGAALASGVPPRWGLVPLVMLAVAGATRLRALPAGLSASSLLGAVIATGLVALTQFGNGTLAVDGAIELSGPYRSESLFHAALSQQLRYSFPVELLPGIGMSYHVLYNLVAALTADLTGASMLDVHFRLTPVIFVPGMALAGSFLAERLGAPPRLSFLAGIAPFLVGDLSWAAVAAGFWAPDAIGIPYWERIFGVPLVYGLHHNRPLVAGLAPLLAGLALLAARGPTFAVAVLLALPLAFKVFFGPLVLAGLGLAALVSPADERRSSLRLLGATSLCLLPLLALTFPVLPGGETPLDFLPGFPVLLSLVRLGIFPDWSTLREVARADPVGFIVFRAVPATVIFTIATLGVRAVGLVTMARAWRNDGRVGRVLAGVVVAGLGGSLLLTTPGARANVVYFWGIALALSAVLAGAEMARRIDGTDRVRRLAWVAAMAGLGLPCAIQTTLLGGLALATVDLRSSASIVETAATLVREGRAGDVVAEPDPKEPFLPALAPVRPLLGWPEWLRYAFGKEVVLSRLDDLARLYDPGDLEAARAVAARYEVRWIWVPAGRPLPAIVGNASPADANADGRLYRIGER